jgi:hypothetical protein
MHFSASGGALCPVVRDVGTPIGSATAFQFPRPLPNPKSRQSNAGRSNLIKIKADRGSSCRDGIDEHETEFDRCSLRPF